MRRLVKKQGQVWVETVIYTLIGLAIMGIILAMAKPKIDEMKDKIVIEQSIEAMNNINDKIYEVQRAAGNRRAVELKISDGKLVFDVDKNEIYWILEVSYMYSEPGITVPKGALEVTTIESSPWTVNLSMDYSVDLKFDNQSSGTKELVKAPVDYKLILESRKDSNGELIVDIWEG